MLDPQITHRALKWKYKKSAHDFFSCAKLTQSDQCKFVQHATDFFTDTENQLCMLVQCSERLFPRVPIAHVEIFQGCLPRKRALSLRNRVVITKPHVYIARVPKAPPPRLAAPGVVVPATVIPRRPPARPTGVVDLTGDDDADNNSADNTTIPRVGAGWVSAAVVPSSKPLAQSEGVVDLAGNDGNGSNKHVAGCSTAIPQIGACRAKARPARGAFTCGPEQFRTLTQSLTHCRTILAGNRHGACFSKTSRAHGFLCALLKRHRHAEFNELAPVDVDYFSVDPCEGPYVQNYSFYVVLRDGRRASFSFLHCLGGLSQGTALKTALRRYVQPQIAEFKAASLSDFVACSLCGSQEVRALQVDHASPQFAPMVDTFLSTLEDAQKRSILIRGFGFDDEYKDDMFPLSGPGLWIMPDHIAQAWIAYHKQHALLRFLCKPCNQSRKRKSAD